jgi:hypothetical protein
MNMKIKEETEMTMEEPKETNEAKVEIVADGKVIPPKKEREELRINIIIKGNHIIMGAQASDCDPRMTALQGDLAAAIARIPSFVEESNRQWDASPHNPRSTVPEPVHVAPIRTATTTAGMATKPTPAKPTQPAQPNFF